MRLLFIIPALTSGGAEKLLIDIISSLLVRNYDVNIELVVFSNHKSVYSEYLKSLNVNVYYFSNGSVYSLKCLYKLFIHLYKHKYDVIHVNLFPAIYYVGIISFFLKLQLVYTEHSTYNRRRNKYLFKILDKLFYSRYRKIVGISEEVTSIIIRHLKMSNDSFTTISNGINIDNIVRQSPCNSSLYRGFEKNINLIMVSRFTEAKDHATLIYALKQLNSNVHLILIGEGARQNDIQKIVSELDLVKRVHFLGYVSNVIPIIKRCDIGILSSKWEGFGLSAVEVMSCGKPLIASDVPGLSSVVSGAGLLFKQGSSDDLARCIKDLIYNKDEYELIASRCLIRSQQYDIKLVADKYFSLYNYCKL